MNREALYRLVIGKVWMLVVVIVGGTAANYSARGLLHVFYWLESAMNVSQGERESGAGASSSS